MNFFIEFHSIFEIEGPRAPIYGGVTDLSKALSSSCLPPLPSLSLLACKPLLGKLLKDYWWLVCFGNWFFSSAPGSCIIITLKVSSQLSIVFLAMCRSAAFNLN